MTFTESPGETIGRSGIGTAQATVAALAGALAAGRLTSAELVRHYLDRIERHNAGLRAVISVSQDAAGQAAGSDSARASGDIPGPLAGIPVLIKDNIAVSGSPATAGSPALLGAAAQDAFLVGRLRAAGAVILGKANLSEWANFRSTHSSSGWSTLGGQAVNPHGSGRNPSGSSSGSAVAVAAGLAPLAVGTETDGSIVSPAHACGIVGIKPTLGLISRAGIVPISAEQDTAGPMTATVADAAALLGALAGPDEADEATARSAGQPADYTAFLDASALAGARIGVWREGAERAVPAAAAVLDEAVSVLRAGGAEVVDPVELKDAADIGEPEMTALRHEFRSDLDAYLADLGGEHPRSLAELVAYNAQHADQVLAHFGQEIFEQARETGGRPDPLWRPARERARTLARSALDWALAEHNLDAVLALSGNPAWLTDHVLGDSYSVGTSSPAAVAGYPSITVPAGAVSGLPVGVSLTGPAWSEPRLIALAYAYEQARSSLG
jgi:amidase